MPYPFKPNQRTRARLEECTNTYQDLYKDNRPQAEDLKLFWPPAKNNLKSLFINSMPTCANNYQYTPAEHTFKGKQELVG